ncbi:hypothetical protein [Paenibacillus sp. RC67]|uniref:hypothetical protein n=1 Tax=Paenibacillus sp. RC67 TaxID=3039392 RepID=UPI0024AD4C0B|nr:hypothetical protein [Paenibacillus sp. RC67]
MRFVVTLNFHSAWRFTRRLFGTLLTLAIVLMAITACSADKSVLPISTENTPAIQPTETVGTDHVVLDIHEPEGTPISADVRMHAFDTSYFDQVNAIYKNAPALVDTQPYLVVIEGSYQKLKFTYKLTSPLLDVPQMLSDAGYGQITDSALINRIFGKTENDVYGRASDNTLIAWSVEHGIDDDLTVVYGNSSDGNLPNIKTEPKVKYVFDPSFINKVVNVYKDTAPDFSIPIGTPPIELEIYAVGDMLTLSFFVNTDSRDAHIKSLQTTLETAGFTQTGEFFHGYEYKKGKINARYDYGGSVDGVSGVSVSLLVKE